MSKRVDGLSRNSGRALVDAESTRINLFQHVCMCMLVTSKNFLTHPRNKAFANDHLIGFLGLVNFFDLLPA